MFTCLFASGGTDLRAVLAQGEDALAAHVAGLWSARGDRYSELRGRPEVRDRRRVEMYLIGG